MAALRKIWGWCKRHLILVTLFAVSLLVVFTFVNIHVLHLTSEPEFCALCHPAKGYGPLAEVDSWEHSGHSAAGVSCLDCHGRPGMVGYAKAKMGGLRDLYLQFTISPEEKLAILSNPDKDLVPSETCLFCHSDQENRSFRENKKINLPILKMRLSDEVENPTFRRNKGLPDILNETNVGGSHFDHAFHLESFDMSCSDCHFGVVHREKSKTDRMNMCLVCHAENQGSSAPQLQDCTVCHETQLAMNEGRGAKDLKGDPSLMFSAHIDCQMCHTGVTKGLFRPSGSMCASCHDSSYPDIYQDWVAETTEELEKVNFLRLEMEAALDKADQLKRDTEDAWEIFRDAQAKLKFVENDGTRGIHNRFYAESVLKNAEENFERVRELLKNRW